MPGSASRAGVVCRRWQARRGVGAVVLGNTALVEGILNFEDELAQIALLACSRLIQTPLPVQMIGPLLRYKTRCWRAPPKLSC